MKSKKSLYFLVPIVIIVWGLIGYRIFEMTKSQSFVVNSPLTIVSSVDSVIVKPLTPLLLNYADPFLKQSIQNNDDIATKENVFFKNPEPEKKIVIWPEIEYKGIIENKKKKMAILKIDDKRVIAGKYSIFEKDMEIKEIYSDSIIIEKNKEIKVFFK